MKGQAFRSRLRFALSGLRAIRRTEASFRTQLRLAAAAAIGLVAVRPGLMWAALVLLTVGLVLTAEALNAAFEYLADALHPEYHPLVGAAKDAAAGAVLIASVTALGVAAATAYSCLP